MRFALAFFCLLLAAPVSGQEVAPAAAGPELATDPDPMVQAYLRRMQSDLRNLLSAQEIHYSEHYRYAGPAEDVNAVEALRFRTSQGVALEIVDASERGWSGVASMEALPGRGCALVVGSAAAVRTPGGPEVTEAGRVICD